MATSGSTDYSLNAGELYEHAANLINAIPLGQSLSDAQRKAISRSSNLMLKTWSAHEPPFLFTIKEKTAVTIVSAQQSYTIGPAGADITLEKPLRVMSVRLRHTTNETDFPLREMQRDEYQNYITGKTSVSATGFPTAYYYDPQRATGTLYLNAVPNASTASAYTLRFDYKRHIEDLDAVGNDLDMPQEWLETFVYNLAVRIRPIFPAIKLEEIQDVTTLAAGLFTIMPVWTGPADENLCFQPDAPEMY